jgi:hypothetical protein
MRTTRSSWGLLIGAAMAVAICFGVAELGQRAIAPTPAAWPGAARPANPVKFRDVDWQAPVRRDPRRPEFNPPLPDPSQMILYTSPMPAPR